MKKSHDSNRILSSPPRDPDRPSTWAPYRDGLCEGCQAGCCSLPVEVSVADLVQLGILGPGDAREDSKHLERALLARGVIQAGLASPGSFILRQTDAGVCRYLGADRRCTVYERRPEVCRSFPSIGPRAGFCPANPLEQGPRKDQP